MASLSEKSSADIANARTEGGLLVRGQSDEFLRLTQLSGIILIRNIYRTYICDMCLLSPQSEAGYGQSSRTQHEATSKTKGFLFKLAYIINKHDLSLQYINIF